MYIVIEKHGGWEYASIAMDKDGNNKVFEILEEAQEEADEWQDGIVVGDEIIKVDSNTFIEELQAIYNMIANVEEDEPDSGSIPPILQRLDKLLNQLKEEV